MSASNHSGGGKRRRGVGAALGALLLWGAASATGAGSGEISLAGEWEFAMDPADVGITEGWFGRPLAGVIQLPASMPERNLGEDITPETPWTGTARGAFLTDPHYAPYRRPGHVKIPFWLTPRKYYVGAAWYRRVVNVPTNWTGRRVVLFLERPHWGTTVWWDRQKAGAQDSLSTPHVYDLTDLATPGRHVVTVRVDNRLLVPVGENAHSVSDHTQGNWNGLIGKLKLISTPGVWIEDARIYPEVASRSVRVRLILGNRTGAPRTAALALRAAAVTGATPYQAPLLRRTVQVSGEETTVELHYPLGSGARPWDEFSPTVYELRATLSGGKNAAATRHEYRARFGLRELGQKGTQFTVNGREIFLRGTLECCIFPYTGHPPMEPAYWRKLMRVARAHGLNHLRFHSWCPPEAAFRAADELGFYLHVECAAWGNADNPALRKFIEAEADRILRAYGNHPSFCFLAYGNEPGGKHKKEWFARLVRSWRARDPRRKYVDAAGWPAIPENDYQVMMAPRIQRWGAGLKSRINARPPETVTDYSGIVARFKVPVVSHEMGEWCVYPNLKERAKYTGVMRALNFDIFADSLAAHGMSGLADDFLHASGKLQVLCYKEDIESALRTAGLGGFQLLDLHDFPGQGTALVGVLDPFWEQKGYVTPAEYRRFCNTTVPLALLPRRVFRAGETLSAGLKIAHFGPEPLRDAVVRWQLTDATGTVLTEGVFPRQTIPLGNADRLGKIETPLPETPEARKLRLVVRVENTPFRNDWDLWVYPRPLPKVPGTEAIYYCADLDETAVARLAAGGRVFLNLPPDRVRPGKNGPVATGFSSIFWNTAWTHGQPPHTLGILCDPRHPALAHFPTEAHSNWQWWYLMHDAQAMILDPLPPELTPIVRVIDDWVTNRRLALAFAARVGRGRILVSTLRLWPARNDPALDGAPNLPAEQLRYSFEKYLTSDAFNPPVTLTLDQLRALLKE